MLDQEFGERIVRHAGSSFSGADVQRRGLRKGGSNMNNA
jgi:hypothetical protein